jgi:flagellar motor switch/type III secretory pathway protein FliN
VSASRSRTRYTGFESLPVPINVRVGGALLSLERLRALAPGDLIRLDRSVGTPFDLNSGELLLGRVDPVADEDRVAVKLVDCPEEDDEPPR